MVAVSHPHIIISAIRSMLAVWSTRRGGRGAWRSENTSHLHPLWGSGAARNHPLVAVSHGRSGPGPRITVGRGRVCGPYPSSGTSAYCGAGVPGVRVVAHHRLHSRAHSVPTMRAFRTVMELRPNTPGGKSVPRRCLPRRCPRQVLVGVGVLLCGTLKSAVH